jgi:prolyl-tRNA synthetase
MPLGLRTLRKLQDLCREEMERAGGIEIAMPHVHPADNWREGPRWAAAREIMFRADGAGAHQRVSGEPDFVLGPTHEEIITPLVKTEITSYRDLPKNFFQIGTKFRNEIRPRYGLMRARELREKLPGDEGRVCALLCPRGPQGDRRRGRHRRHGRQLLA